MSTTQQKKVSIRKKSDKTQVAMQGSPLMSGWDLINNDGLEMRFLVEGLIPAGTVSLLTGPSDTGKSIFARQLALSIVREEEFFIGRKLNWKSNKVIYGSTEDAPADWKLKLLKYELDSEGKECLKRMGVVFELENIELLKQLVTKNEIELVVVDVFTDIFSGDLNNAIQVRAFFAPLKKLCRDTGCTFLLIHHLNKRGESGQPSKLNVLGSQGIESSVRSVLELRSCSGDEDMRTVSITKGNYLSVKDKNKTIKLKLNDRLLFEYVGETISNSERQNISEQRDTVQKVVELHKQKLSTRGIAAKLKEEGIQIGKTAVSNIIRKAA